MGSWTELGNHDFSFPRLKRKFVWRIIYAYQRLMFTFVGKDNAARFWLLLTFYAKRLALESIIQSSIQRLNIPIMGATRLFLEQTVNKDTKVLDIGCSIGHWSGVASSLGARCLGIDTDRSSIEKAKSSFPQAQFELTSIEDFLDRNSDIFDLAIMTHILEHLENPTQILQMLKERTRKFIIEVPDIESDPLNYGRLIYNLPFYTDSDHVREYSLETLTILLQNVELRIISVVKLGGSIAVLAE